MPEIRDRRIGDALSTLGQIFPGAERTVVAKLNECNSENLSQISGWLANLNNSSSTRGRLERAWFLSEITNDYATGMPGQAFSVYRREIDAERQGLSRKDDNAIRAMVIDRYSGRQNLSTIAARREHPSRRDHWGKEKFTKPIQHQPSASFTYLIHGFRPVKEKFGGLDYMRTHYSDFVSDAKSGENGQAFNLHTARLLDGRSSDERRNMIQEFLTAQDPSQPIHT